jgi:hypothetical protein
MRVVLILVASYLVGTMFNLVQDTEPTNYFLIGGVELSLKTHFYFICDHVSRLLLVYALVLSLKIKGIELFFWIELFDLIDYLICYNTQWFSFFGYSMGFNDFKFLIIIVFLAQTAWKYRQ